MAWTPGRPARPETVGLYLSAMAATLQVSTLERRLAAIAVAHRLAGHQLDTRHPAIRDVLRGIRHAHGSARRQAAAATVDLVKAMVASCDDALLGRRDQALLLLGFAGAFRRSELVALQVEDVVEEESGLRLTIRRSKGDQAGAGQVVGISRTGSATCPVAALAAWREAAAIAAGPLFRSVDRHGRIGDSLSDKAVALVVKRRAELAGLDPALFSGHSLRAGLATSAAAHGLEERDIQRQTRHRSLTVLRRYIRDGDLFRANVSGRVGL
jgi:integrase